MGVNLHFVLSADGWILLVEVAGISLSGLVLTMGPKGHVKRDISYYRFNDQRIVVLRHWPAASLSFHKVVYCPVLLLVQAGV